MTLAFFLYKFSVVGCQFLTTFLMGLCVRHKNVKVNYTRKVTHISMFFIPLLLKKIFPFEHSFITLLGGCVALFASCIVYVKPIRERVPVVATMFLSFDRPEDRPHTLLWLSSQLFVGYLVFIPMAYLFAAVGLESLIAIPLLIVAFGDGLAEPIGVRFGKHLYRVKALFTEKLYTRSLEGSACVFAVGVIVICLYQPAFTTTEWVVALLTVPPLMTLVEAYSPHTWDSPALFLAGYSALFMIVQFA